MGKKEVSREKYRFKHTYQEARNVFLNDCDLYQEARKGAREQRT